MQHDSRGLAEALIGDGRSLITFCGICLGLAGLFATFQSMTGHFLPHDVAYLKMQPEELCGINECRIVHFMIHDRAGFGGAVTTAGILTLASVWFGQSSRALWQTLAVGGFAGWSTAVLVHPAIGYTDPIHLAPAVIGAA